MYRVVFPFELKLCNITDDCEDADAVYDLFAVVVHIGSGMNHGKEWQCMCRQEILQHTSCLQHYPCKLMHHLCGSGGLLCGQLHEAGAAV